MSASKHTPGPWKVDVRSGCVAVYPASEDYNCLDIPDKYFIHYKQGQQGEGGGWKLDPEVEANALLIAAAPTLVEALECLLEPTYSRKAAEHKARAALQSARGEEVRPERATCEVCGVRLNHTATDGRCWMHTHAREGTQGRAAIAAAKGEEVQRG